MTKSSKPLKFLTRFRQIGAFALCAALCAGCHQDIRSDVEAVQVYDGCEYLCFTTHNGFAVWTHKGNCTNAIHGHVKSNMGGYWHYDGPSLTPGVIPNFDRAPSLNSRLLEIPFDNGTFQIVSNRVIFQPLNWNPLDFKNRIPL